MPTLLLAIALIASAAAPADVDSRLAEAARLEQSGKTADALVLYRSLLGAVPAGDLRRGQILHAISGIENDSGDYAAAVKHATEAAAIFAAHGDTRRRALALNRVGHAHLYAGEYQAALPALNSAIQLSTAARDDASRAEELTNLGNVDYFLGRYTESASAYDSALAITKAHAAESWAPRRHRIILVNQATLNQRLGRDEDALAIYQQVNAAGGDLRPREQAQILTNLGVLYRRLGDPIKALRAYDEARALFVREKQIDGELGVMKNRGIVLALDLNQLDAARQNFTEALEKATKVSNRREMLQAQLYRAETELRLGILQDAQSDFAASVDAARALKTPEEEWKALYGLGRVALRRGERTAAVRELESAVAVIEKIREAIRVPFLRSDFFSDKREVYDALIATEIGRAQPQRIFEMIERSHSRAWREKLGLTAAPTLAAVQRALPAGVLLLETWSSANGSAIVEVTRDRAQIKPANVDAKLVKQLTDSLATGPSAASARAAASLAASMSVSLPTSIHHVIVVPDGPLALVPFEILPVNGRMLVDQAAVSYVPTAAMLFRKAEKPRLRAPWTLQMRAFADPLVNSAKPLRASGDEVRGIASELGGRSTLRLGREDRKSYLYDSKMSAPILHIASHAIADTNAVEQSRILFTGDYLFVREAYELPLRDTELAVLSACDTERGRMLRGEGVQSFSRAFLAAGARSTVTTLWRVPDEPTAAFMKVFYHHLQRGVSRAEALRLAKLRFIRSGSALSDPHYWAAFVLSGEGEEAIPRAIRWSTIVMIGAAIATLLFCVIFVVSFSSRSL